jgi:LPS sulfotransferase NodH
LHPHTSYLICATPRSGSSLLAEALGSTNIAGRPKEYFLPEEHPDWSKRWETTSYIGQPSGAIDVGMTPNGVFGAKIMWTNFFSLIASMRRITGDNHGQAHTLVSEFFPNLRYVWITRRDKVRQAVSSWRRYEPTSGTRERPVRAPRKIRRSTSPWSMRFCKISCSMKSTGTSTSWNPA